MEAPDTPKDTRYKKQDTKQISISNTQISNTTVRVWVFEYLNFDIACRLAGRYLVSWLLLTLLASPLCYLVYLQHET